MRRLLASAAAALFLLLSTFGWLLSRRLVRPLLQMKNAADQMAQGEYTTRLQAPGSDELGELAASINRLAASLGAGDQPAPVFRHISHELWTPLSYLQGYADVLAEGLASTPEEVRAYGRILADEARRLGKARRSISSSLAQAEEGRLSLKMAAGGIGHAIQRATAGFRPAVGG